MENLDIFTSHYLITMLWSEIDDEDGTYTLSDIDTTSLQLAIVDCKSFQKDNAELLVKAYEHYVSSGISDHPDTGSPEACAGLDFWLTRAGHGVGYWDRGMGRIGEDLTKAAEDYGPLHAYIGDDGKVYID